MEIKATLNKPYTKEEKTKFILLQNHKNGYEIRETADSLEAWGKSFKEEFEKAKQLKLTENDNKSKLARTQQEFSLIINNIELFFDTTRETQQDLTTAKDFLSSGAEKYDWWDNKGTYFAFTDVEQILQVSIAFMEKANIYSIWAYFKNLIDNAQTKEELENIDINYDINLGEQNDITNEDLSALDSREQ